MPELEVQNRRMGAWEFTLDEEGNVLEIRVSMYFQVQVEGEPVGVFTTMAGVDTDIWPLLTQGKRNQVQSIVDGVLELIEEA